MLCCDHRICDLEVIMSEEVYHELSATTQKTYQIRVEGRLDAETWAQWFEGMRVEVKAGNTIITGPLPDQSALYGVLTRLRDMALPLVSVEEVDLIDPAEFHEGWRKRRRFNWGLFLTYLIMVGGLSAMTVFLSMGGIHVAFALGITFVATGLLAIGFYGLDRGRGWLIPALISGLGAASSLVVYVMVVGIVSVALGTAVLCFAIGGVILALSVRQQARIDKQRRVLEQAAAQEREALGTRR
jgi:hypothetical protein